MRKNFLMKNCKLGLCAFVLFASCNAIPLADPPTPQHAKSDGKDALPFLKKRSVIAEEANVPSRDFDVNQNNRGRLTLVEMHRQILDELDELKAKDRNNQILLKEFTTENETLKTQVANLASSLTAETEKRKSFERENLELTERLLQVSLRLAETEKQLLQMKISSLSEEALLPVQNKGFDSRTPKSAEEKK